MNATHDSGGRNWLSALCSLLLVLFATVAFASPPAPSLEADVTQGALRVQTADGGIVECPLKHTDVKASVSGFIARATVTQTFYNPYDEKIEAVYVFPLPHTAAVDGMTMVIGDRKVVGVIKRRAEARAIYEAALQQGMTASLLEQERPNIFTQSVGNIKPKQEVKIVISYVDVLKYDMGTYEFHFPMVVGPRYNPGAPIGKAPEKLINNATASAPDTDVVPDASRINPPVLKPGYRNGHDISLSLTLDAGVPIQDLQVVNHQANATRQSRSAAEIVLDPADSVPNKDFVVRYAVTGEKPEMALLTHSKGSRQGYFMLMVQPRSLETELAKAQAREVVFLIDVSGSMSGEPTEKVKQTMRQFFKTMKTDDTLQVVTFAGQADKLFPNAVPASKENCDKALTFTDGINGGGGTEMLKGIQKVLEDPADPKRVRIVVMLTDGYIGNEAQIIAEVGKRCGDNIRFWTVGIGSSPNRFLLDGVAKQGGGGSAVIELKTDPTEAVAQIAERIHRAQLANIKIDWNGLPVYETYPRRIPELWAGRPVIVFGRYFGGGEKAITISGTAEGEALSFSLPVTLPFDEQLANDVLAPIWARQKIEDLTAQAFYADTPEVVEEVTNIALEYRLMSAYTSFVAVDEDDLDELDLSGKMPRRVPVALPLPDGMSYEGVFGAEVFEGLPEEMDARDEGGMVAFKDVPASHYAGRAREVAGKPRASMTSGERFYLKADELSIDGSVALTGAAAGKMMATTPAPARPTGGAGPAGPTGPAGAPVTNLLASGIGLSVAYDAGDAFARTAPSPTSATTTYTLLDAAGDGIYFSSGALTTRVDLASYDRTYPASRVVVLNGRALDLPWGRRAELDYFQRTRTEADGWALFTREAQQTRHTEAKTALNEARQMQKKGLLLGAYLRAEHALVLESAYMQVNPGTDDGTLTAALQVREEAAPAIAKNRLATQPKLKGLVTLRVTDVPLKQALRQIADQVGLKLELVYGSFEDAAAMGAVSEVRVPHADLQKVTAADALDQLLAPSHLVWRLTDKDTITVGSTRRMAGTSAWVYDIGDLAVPDPQEMGGKPSAQAVRERYITFLAALRFALQQPSNTALKPNSAVYLDQSRLLVNGDVKAHARVAAVLAALKDGKLDIAKAVARTMQPSEKATLVALQQTTAKRWAARATDRTARLQQAEQSRVAAALRDYAWPLLASAVKGAIDREALANLTIAWKSSQLKAVQASDPVTVARAAWAIGEARQRMISDAAGILVPLATRAQETMEADYPNAVKALQANKEDQQAHLRLLYASLVTWQSEADTLALLDGAAGKESSIAIQRAVAALSLAPTPAADKVLETAIKERTLKGDDLVLLAASALQMRGGDRWEQFRAEMPELLGRQPLNGNVLLIVNRLAAQPPLVATR